MVRAYILAVDDHLPNLIVLEALLGELNVKTTKALSGQEALISSKNALIKSSNRLIWCLWTFKCRLCQALILLARSAL